jgi:hypothetical protein
MKRSFAGVVVLFAVLAFAAYFRSWWLVMCGLFLFAVEYASQEFTDLKQRLIRLEEAQKETLRIMFDAVDEFALIVGETPQDGGESLSKRIRLVRASIEESLSKVLSKE